MFHGTITALITPFRNGKIGEKSLRMHVERQIEAGVNAVVPAGTTGEAATLSFAEHKHLIEISVQMVQGRIPVIAGTGSNNTAESIELTKSAKALGADAALLISPYYNKPTQEGIYQHYKAIAEAVHLPLIIYNVPGRTHSNILPQTVVRLSRIANIVGIKDATADMEQTNATMAACEGRIDFFSGDDATVLPFMALGGAGVISVVSNIVPQAMLRLTDAAAGGDWAEARAAQIALAELNRMMFVQSNPIPVKAAAAMMGWILKDMRLPLTVLPDDLCDEMHIALTDFGLQPERTRP